MRNPEAARAIAFASQYLAAWRRTDPDCIKGIASTLGIAPQTADWVLSTAALVVAALLILKPTVALAGLRAQSGKGRTVLEETSVHGAHTVANLLQKHGVSG